MYDFCSSICDRSQKTLAGIEVVHMIKKGQYRYSARGNKSPAELFYSLAT